MLPLTAEDLTSGKLDLDHIAEIANSTASSCVDRHGNTKPTVAGAVASLSLANNRGEWSKYGVTYELKDIVSIGGIWYICVARHITSTSSVFSTDAAIKWQVHQGATKADLASVMGASGVGCATIPEIGSGLTVQAALEWIAAKKVTSLTTPHGVVSLPAIPAPPNYPASPNPSLAYQASTVYQGGQEKFGKWRQYHNAAEWGWGITYNAPIDPHSLFPWNLQPDAVQLRDTSSDQGASCCVAMRFDVAEGTSGSNFWGVEWAPSSGEKTKPDWNWGPSMYFFEGTKASDSNLNGAAGGLLQLVSSAGRESALSLRSSATAGPVNYLMRSSVPEGAVAFVLQDVSAFNWAAGVMPKRGDGIDRLVVGTGMDNTTGTTDVVKIYGQLKVFPLGSSAGSFSCTGNVGFNGVAPLPDAIRHIGYPATDLASSIELLNGIRNVLLKCGLALV